MQNRLGEIRRSQVVQTYGPGAIVDFRAGAGGDAAISVVTTGLEDWEKAPLESTSIHEPRLQKLLGVRFFRLAPVAPEKPQSDKSPIDVFLLGRRFPLWQQCPKCHRIARFGRFKETPGDPALLCPWCNRSGVDVRDGILAVPVRFVMTCSRGHLDEFDWEHWAHGGPPCERPLLILESMGGTGLASLVLRCETCKQSRNMDGALSKGTFEGHKCRGRRPWLDTGEAFDEEECDESPIAVQRGASNLYFPKSYSSLDIPPWSDPMMKVLGSNWEALSETPEEERAGFFRNLDRTHRYTARLGISAEEILQAVETRRGLLDDLDPEAIHREEHLRLLDPTGRLDPGHEFETLQHPVPSRLTGFVSHLIEVRKLREVRALTGFTRVTPPGPDDSGDRSTLCRLSREDLGWLPAAEIRGEGIYIELDQRRIDDWRTTQRKALDQIVLRLRRRYEVWWESTGREGEPPEQPIDPTYLLVHTLAHALIRQLALDCGYSSASLRERIYFQMDGYRMHGLLIYTGSTDADGTLGGLSRQSHPKRIETLVVDAIRNLAWCSNDPLCIHGEASSEPLNRAACHSCALVAETSCTTFNQLLDRSVLVGTPADRKSGFFAPLLTQSDLA